MCEACSNDIGIKSCCVTYWSWNQHVSGNPRFSVCFKHFLKKRNTINENKICACSGPKGVWTMEKEGKSPQVNISFSEALPTKCHMALKALLDSGHIKYIVSQNIDGLHLRSGIPRSNIAELHGNMFIDVCDKCRR